jgi:type IV secretory pathway TrbF-like protein
MVISACLLAFNAVSKSAVPWVLLAGEILGLLSFGVAWLTASKFIFATDKERLKPWVVRRDSAGKMTSIDILTSAEAEETRPEDGKPGQDPHPRRPTQAPA